MNPLYAFFPSGLVLKIASWPWVNTVAVFWIHPREDSTFLCSHMGFCTVLSLRYYFFLLNHMYDIMINFQHITLFPLLSFQKASDIKNTPQATGSCLESHNHTARLQSLMYWLKTFFFPKACDIMSVSINTFVVCSLTMTLTSFEPFG